MNPVVELMRRHRSVRRYTEAPLPGKRLAALVEAAQMASTSSHGQAYCVIRVTDSPERIRLAELCGNQSMVHEAAAFLVVCGDLRRHGLLADRTGHRQVENLETFLVAVIDASLFAQNLALACESDGLGICYVGALRNHLDEVDALLELPDGVLPLFGLCIGEPAALPETKPRLPLEAVLFDGRYPPDETMLEHLETYDDTMRAYYGRRGIEGRLWSDGVIRRRESARRQHLPATFRRKGADLGPGQ